LGELERVVLVTHKPSIERLLKQAAAAATTITSAYNSSDDEKEQGLVDDRSRVLGNELKGLCDSLEQRRAQLDVCTGELEALDKLAQISMGLAEKLAVIQNAVPTSTDEQTLNKHLVSILLFN
jgi:PleD family two-component response regulator